MVTVKKKQKKKTMGNLLQTLPKYSFRLGI